MSNESPFDYLFKILMIGDTSTGKTNILSRFISDRFMPNSNSTLGVEFSTRNVSIDGKNIKVQCWDTAGEEKYKSITNAYYRGAVGALLVYDITRRSTFDHCLEWLDELREYTSENVVTLLVGNKTDLRHLREVASEEGMVFAKSHEISFVETSAQSGANIDKAFHIILKEILEGMNTNVTKTDDLQNRGGEPQENTTNIVNTNNSKQTKKQKQQKQKQKRGGCVIL